MIGNYHFESHFVNFKVGLEGEFPCEMRFGSFHPEKLNFRVHLDPNSLVRYSHSEISVNLELYTIGTTLEPPWVAVRVGEGWVAG